MLGSPALTLEFFEIVLCVFQQCSCIVAFAVQAIAFLADAEMFRAQSRDPRFALEQRIGRRVTAAAKNNSLSRNNFIGMRCDRQGSSIFFVCHCSIQPSL